MPEDHQSAAHADRAPHRPAVEAAQEGAVGGTPARLGHGACLVHPGLHPQLLARRQPERPGGRSRAEHESGHRQQEEQPRGPAASARSARCPRATWWGATSRAARAVRRGGARRGRRRPHLRRCVRRARRAAVRRTPSTAQPAACPSAVAVRTQARTTSWAPTRCPGGVTSAVTARRLHACTIQARLTGASSSAPRCSVTRADRVDGRLAARQQLAAAAAAHGGADRQQQEAGEGGAEVALEGGERPLDRGRAAGLAGRPARASTAKTDGQRDHDGQAERRRRRDGVRSARGTPSGDGCRAPPPARRAARCQSRRAR